MVLVPTTGWRAFSGQFGSSVPEMQEEYDVVLTEEDVARLQERSHFGIAAQTTQPMDRVRWLVALIRNKFPKSEVRFHDTVCQPTKQRQSAAVELEGALSETGGSDRRCLGTALFLPQPATQDQSGRL